MFKLQEQKNVTQETKSEKTLGRGDTAWLVDSLASGGLTSESGVYVSAGTAIKDPRVLGAISALSQDIAKVPVNLWQIDASGNRRIVVKSPLQLLMNRKPNTWQSPFEFKEYQMWSKLLDGNAYALKVYNPEGAIQELVPINPARVTLYESANGFLFYHISRGTNFERAQLRLPEEDEKYWMPAEFMWHLRYFPYSSGIQGKSPIAYARDTIGLSMSQERQASSSARQGARVAGVLRHPKLLSADAANRLRSQWQNNYAGQSNAGKTVILEDGMEFQQVQMSMADAQFVEQRKLTVLDICRIFRIPPTKLMDMSRSTYSNVENENLAYLTDSLMPIFERWESSMNVNLLTPQQQSQGYFFEFDIERLNRGDFKSRAEGFTKYIQHGVFSPNEVRKKLGENPYEGGDAHIAQVNMAPVDMLGQIGQDPMEEPPEEEPITEE